MADTIIWVDRMVSDKKKMSKEKIRSIWIIYALSNCKKWKQEQIVDYLNKKSQEIHKLHKKEVEETYNTQLREFNMQHPTISNPKVNKHNNLLTKEDKTIKLISKGMTSRILKSLKADGIIHRETIPKEGRGPDHYGYTLIKNYDTLNRILSKFSDPELDKYFASSLAKLFISSKYSKEIINLKLVDLMAKRCSITFTDNEKKMILKIIKISPKALFNWLNIGYDLGFMGYPSFEAVYGYDKNILLFHLQMELGEDIICLSPFSDKKFEYKISFSVVDQEIGEKIESVITPKSNNMLKSVILSDTEYSPI